MSWTSTRSPGRDAARVGGVQRVGVGDFEVGAVEQAEDHARAHRGQAAVLLEAGRRRRCCSPHSRCPRTHTARPSPSDARAAGRSGARRRPRRPCRPAGRPGRSRGRPSGRPATSARRAAARSSAYCACARTMPVRRSLIAMSPPPWAPQHPGLRLAQRAGQARGRRRRCRPGPRVPLRRATSAAQQHRPLGPPRCGSRRRRGRSATRSSSRLSRPKPPALVSWSITSRPPARLQVAGCASGCSG